MKKEQHYMKKQFILQKDIACVSHHYRASKYTMEKTDRTERNQRKTYKYGWRL
jgi:hypothetical protein